jgi:integrase/recombinase XerD
MNTKTELNIKTAMSGVLNSYQMAVLDRVLKIYTTGEVSHTKKELQNDHLLTIFLSAKKIEGCSTKSLAYYQNTLNVFLRKVNEPVASITTEDVRTYLAEYQQSHLVGNVSVDNMRRIFSTFFSWLENEDYIVKSPVKRIHKVKTEKTVKETYSDETVEILRDSCNKSRDLAIVDMLSSTGIRVGELVHLNRTDINFEERECIVLGKGNKQRHVYFDARTKLHLQNYLSSRTDSSLALFVTLDTPHLRLQIGGVESRLRHLGKQVNIQKVHPHKFRRTMATRAIDKGMPIEQVQRLLGHQKIDTTLQYAIVNQNNVKISHRKYIG